MSQKEEVNKMNINCMIDSKHYKDKPTVEEYRADKVGYNNTIDARIRKAPYSRVTVKELAESIENGRIYLAGHFINKNGKRNKDNIHNINMFSLDIDNDITVKDDDGNNVKKFTNYTEKEVIEKMEQLLNVTPFISYQTFSKSNDDGSKRFRLLYKINGNVDAEEFTALMQYIMNNTGDMLDQACKEPNRLFNGTNSDVKIHKDYKLLDIKVIEDIKAIEEERIQQEQKKQEKERERKRAELISKGYDPTESNNVTEEVNSQDMRDYLHRMIGEAPYGTKRIKCPIHDSKNPSTFSVNKHNGIDMWKCWGSADCGSGNLIQLHMALNNLDFKDALKELCEMYNIKQTITRTRPSISSTTDIKGFTIDKYIGQDKQATNGIIESLNKHDKILITAPMGTGKTHFTIKDIYSYAKALDKKVVLVIPGVAQLSNLNNNKCISIVCNQMPVYMGDDIVATTPESLLKVTAEIGADNYILVVDESHERYSSLYRNGYRDMNIERAETTAFKSIHLTATPDKLVYDNFNKLIDIKSKSLIKSKLTILMMNENTDDSNYTVIEKYLNLKRPVVFFNNDIKTNNVITELFEETRQITTSHYEPGQTDLLRPATEVETITTEIVTSTESISSGKISESITKGNITADLTCTTSTIMAGIDLYTKDDAVLIINTRGLGKDEIIQLIGRFRNGIEVILMVEDREYKKELFDVDAKIERAIKSSQLLADATNLNPDIEELSDAGKGIKDIANLRKDDNGKWIVDVNMLVSKIYDEYNVALLDNPKELKRQLMEQTAFEVDGDIRMFEFNGKLNTILSETKDATKQERKELLKKVSKELCELEDHELENVLDKEYHKLKEETLILCKQYELLAEKHLEKINKTAKHLYTNESGVRDKVKAFRHFYDNTWASIEREIKGQQAREINKLIKKHGLDYYLSIKSGQYRRAVDVIQAKIRHELKDLEQKQGRLSNKRLTQLIETLINENYIYNKHVKALKDEALEEKDRKKALEVVASEVKDLVKDIYNFKDDSNLISSVKE